eukprot:1215483-Alexandrium_andersonii.AAC.1
MPTIKDATRPNTSASSRHTQALDFNTLTGSSGSNQRATDVRREMAGTAPKARTCLGVHGT